MVFYFTATGNSLYIAKQIEPDPVSIPQAMRREQLEFTAERIGVVAPVYGLSLIHICYGTERARLSEPFHRFCQPEPDLWKRGHRHRLQRYLGADL